MGQNPIRFENSEERIGLPSYPITYKNTIYIIMKLNSNGGGRSPKLIKPCHTVVLHQNLEPKFLDINFPNYPGPAPTTMITPSSPNSPGHNPTADNTSDHAVVIPEHPNSSGPTFSSSSGLTPTSASAQDIPTSTTIVIINTPHLSSNILDIPTPTAANTTINIQQRSLPIAVIAGTCVGLTALLSVITMILVVLYIRKKSKAKFSIQGHYSMQYHNPNGDSTEKCLATDSHYLIPSTGQEELTHAHVQGSNPNISETIIDSEYHCDKYSVIASPSAAADCTVDPTYTTLGGTETAVLEDIKSHSTENGSEIQPQHCPLEKETDEDGLKTPADPNAVYAAVDKSKKRKRSGSNVNQIDEDDAPALQVNHVITDSGATYAAVLKPSKKAAIAQDQEKTRRRNPPPAPAPYQEQSCPPNPPPYTDHVESRK